MKFASLLSVIGIAVWGATVSSSLFAEDQCAGGECTTIRVLVAYTQEAEATLLENAAPANCTTIANNEVFKQIYDGLSIIDAADNKVSVTHPCTNTATDASKATIDKINNSTNYIQNVADIGIEELNQIYADSGLGNIRFELADEPYPLGDLDEDGHIIDDPGTTYKEGSSYASPITVMDGNSTILNCFAIDTSNDCFVRVLGYITSYANELIKARNYYNAPDVMRDLSKKRVDTQADIVVLLLSDKYIGGLAGEIGVRDKKNAYAVVQASQANAPGFIFAHEVSHLVGAGHLALKELGLIEDSMGALNDLDIRLDTIASDGTTTNRGIAYTKSDDVGSYPCQMATTNATEIRTLMTYTDYCDKENCTVVPFLSNPNITVAYPGVEVDDEGNTIDDKYTIGTAQCNNADIVSRFADNVSQFGENLEPIVDLDLIARDAKMAKTYSIDFGFATYNGIDYTTDSYYWGYWNNLTDPGQSGPHPLKNQKNETGDQEVSIEVVNGFHGRSRQDFATSVIADYGLDEMPPMAIADGFSTQFAFNPGVFKISGLDKDSTYSFRLFAGGANLTWHQFETFKFTGLTKFQKQVVAQSSPNILNFVTVDGIRPTADGEIFVRVETGITNNGRLIGSLFSTTNINAMEFWPDEN